MVDETIQGIAGGAKDPTVASDTVEIQEAAAGASKFATLATVLNDTPITRTVDLTLENGIAVRGEEVGSTARTLVQMTGADVVQLGTVNNETAITSDGTVTLTGSLSISGFLVRSVTLAITAGSTQTQAGATALTTDINMVQTVGTNGDGVKLPAAQVGVEVMIKNLDAGQTVQVWPATGDSIDAEAVNAVDPNQVAVAEARRYVALNGTQWVTS